MSEIQKRSKGKSGSAQSKTKRTSFKSKGSESGLSVKETLNNLNSNISLAKGLFAILSSKLQSPSISKSLTKQDLADIAILSKDVMDEIWSLESQLLILKEKLENKYFGICLH